MSILSKIASGLALSKQDPIQGPQEDPEADGPIGYGPKRQTRLGMIMQNLPAIIHGGIVGAAQPNIAGGGATDVFRAMLAPQQEQMQRMALLSQLAARNAQARHNNAMSDWYQDYKPGIETAKIGNAADKNTEAGRHNLATEGNASAKTDNALTLGTNREKGTMQRNLNNNSTRALGMGYRLGLPAGMIGGNWGEGGPSAPDADTAPPAASPIPVNELSADKQASIAGRQATTGLTNTRRQLMPGDQRIRQQNANAHTASSAAATSNAANNQYKSQADIEGTIGDDNKPLPVGSPLAARRDKASSGPNDAAMQAAKAVSQNVPDYLKSLKDLEQAGNMLGIQNGNVQKIASTLGQEDPRVSRFLALRASLGGFIGRMHTRGNYQAVKHFVDELGDITQNPAALRSRATAFGDVANRYVKSGNRGALPQEFNSDTQSSLDNDINALPK